MRRILLRNSGSAGQVLIFSNDAFCSILGHTREEALSSGIQQSLVV
jgi:hypothetical protein